MGVAGSEGHEARSSSRACAAPAAPGGLAACGPRRSKRPRPSPPREQLPQVYRRGGYRCKSCRGSDSESWLLIILVTAKRGQKKEKWGVIDVTVLFKGQAGILADLSAAMHAHVFTHSLSPQLCASFIDEKIQHFHSQQLYVV